MLVNRSGEVSFIQFVEVCPKPVEDKSFTGLCEKLLNEIKSADEHHVIVNYLKTEFFLNFENVEKFIDSFKTLLSDKDERLDKLIELLFCPILFTKFQNPVLLSSGHTIELSAALEIYHTTNSNPFTRVALEFSHDTVTKLLLSCILAYRLEEIQSIPPACAELEKQPYFIDAPQAWYGFLAATIPLKTFFVRKKNTNHYVLVGHTSGTPTTPPVFQKSFYLNNNGTFSLFKMPEKEYDTLSELCKEGLEIDGFTALSEEQIHFIENFVAKDVYLKTCQQNPQFAAIAGHLIANLCEGNLNTNDIVNNSIIFRPGRSITSFPSFTALIKNGSSLEKKRACIKNGLFQFLTPVRLEKEESKIKFVFETIRKPAIEEVTTEELEKISNERRNRCGREVRVIDLSNLCENEPDQKAVKKEYSRLLKTVNNLEYLPQFVFIPQSKIVDLKEYSVMKLNREASAYYC